MSQSCEKTFWGYAVQRAAYLMNRIPNQTVGKAPFELKYGKSPDLNIIRVFGCDAYMRIPDNLRKKLDPKSKKMIFIGYSTMGYRLLDPVTKHVIVSRNVKFNEDKKCTNDSPQDFVICVVVRCYEPMCLTEDKEWST